jgi:putative spermidine/putrescine transport system substrate-binding protein
MICFQASIARSRSARSDRFTAMNAMLMRGSSDRNGSSNFVARTARRRKEKKKRNRSLVMMSESDSFKDERNEKGVRDDDDDDENVVEKKTAGDLLSYDDEDGDGENERRIIVINRRAILLPSLVFVSDQIVSGMFSFNENGRGEGVFARADPIDIKWDGGVIDRAKNQREVLTTKRAFKFDVPLKVNSLRGTVQPNVFEEFKEVQASSRLKLEHTACASLQKSFEDLRKGRELLLVEENEEKDNKDSNNNNNINNYKSKKMKKKIQKTSAMATLATLGDAYLKAAIREKLILPFEYTGRERWFKELPDVYKNLCFRDYRTGDIVRSTDPNGRLYAVPYRVTATLLAYREDKLPRGMKEIKDWTDIFDPRFGNKTFVGCANAPREILSAALKMGNYNNTINPKTIDGELNRDALRRLRAKIKVADDQTYLRALQNGDVSVAFGPSDDVLALCRRSSLVKPVFPPSGTALHCDCFVRPVYNDLGGYSSSVPNKPSSSPGINAWLDFVLDSGRINERGGLRSGLNPIQFDGEHIYRRSSAIKDADGDIFKGWLPDDSAFARSEFVLPLSESSIRAYEDISREI